MNPGTYHIPVLADASIAGIGAPQLPSGIYVDATFGGGGHSRLILDALDANGRLFGFDQADHQLSLVYRPLIQAHHHQTSSALELCS